MIKYLQKSQFKNICLGLCMSVIYFFSIHFSIAQTLVTSVEAENGTRAGGLTIGTSNAGYSGSGYVTNMANTGDNLTIPVTVPTVGNYKLVIRYNGPYGPKDQDVYVNGVFVSSLNFPATTGFVDLTAGSLQLNAGSNTIAIYKNWGYTDFDKISLYTVPLHDYTTVVAAPIDPAATPEAIALYNYLKLNYGKSIISGQTTNYYMGISPNAAKKPVIRDYDFQHYTVGYPYAWDNATANHTFGWTDNGATEAAIKWYDSTCQKGIVAFQWHWCSPFGGTAGTNTFAPANTTFDVSKAVTIGTAEYTAVIRDIDSIATQLKKLQVAGVPVMWRPLHEAGGAWFWWGTKGSAAALALYDIMYNRLVNYHGIHNLIWQWSTPEPDWYPGNAKVDMLGYDSYPGAYNYGTQKLIFDQLYAIVDGKKMLALTENGPIPDPDALFVNDAKWSYFMSWDELAAQQNSAAQLSLVYNHSKVITLDEVTTGTNTAQLMAAGPTSFCTNGSVLLKANVAKGYTYKWYNGANVISGATSSSFTATAAGSYTVAVTATGTCTTTSSAIVITTGGPIATITAGGPTSFCPGGSVTLNASTGTGYTYQWLNGGTIIPGETSASYVANATGTYSVKVALGMCNNTSAGTSVITNVLPTATITATGPTTFCTGGSVILNSSTGSSYKWMLGGIAISGATNATYTANGTGSYTVEVNNASTCKATSVAISVTVNALPTTPIITVSGATTFCIGFKTQLNVTSELGSTLVWLLNGNTSSNQSGVINTGGSYSVISTKSGCSSISAPTVITVTNLPVPIITASGATSFCENGSVDLTASVGTSYQWYDGTTLLPGSINAKYTANTSGNYNVIVNNPNGCSATTAPTSVTVNSPPAVAITAGSGTTFCQGGSVVLTSSAGSAYKWMLGGTAISSATNATYTVNTNGSYTVEVTNASGCKATSVAILVTVNAAPIVAITASGATSFCAGGNVTFNASIGTGYTYQWLKDGANISAGTNASYTANTSGTYSVKVTTASSCYSTSSDKVVSVTNTVTWYADTDGDGKGDPNTTIQSCTQPVGYVSVAGDMCPLDAQKTTPENCGCGKTENSCLDCMGMPNGKATLDVCNVCSGGTSGITPKTSIAQCTATSTQSALATNLKMYPNPTSDICNLQVSGSEYRVTIYSASGIELSQNQYTGNAVIGNNLSQGMYLIRIEQDGNVELKKLIKQ
jgi:PKD repeat protein